MYLFKFLLLIHSYQNAVANAFFKDQVDGDLEE